MLRVQRIQQKMRRKRRRVSRRRHSKAVDRIIKLKVKYNLSAEHLRNLVVDMYNREEAEAIIRLVRKDFKNDGHCAHRLHGCAGCEDFIWIHSETMVCPNCNNMDGRYIYLCVVLCLLDIYNCFVLVGTTLRVFPIKKSFILPCYQD